MNMHGTSSAGCLGFIVAVMIGGCAVTTCSYARASHPTNMLVLGKDSAAVPSAGSRADVITLISVRHHPTVVHSISLPRDLLVELPSGKFAKLNAAYAQGGARATVETVQNNFGIQIGSYAVVDYGDVRALIDAIGGIEVKLERPMGGLSAGRHQLNGKETMRFVRHRTGSSDFGRMRRLQQIVLPAIAERLHHNQARVGALRFSLWYMAAGDHAGLIHRIPHVGITLMRSPQHIGTAFSPAMVRETRGSDGAEFLCPNWSQIDPVMHGFGGRAYRPVQRRTAPACRR